MQTSVPSIPVGYQRKSFALELKSIDDENGTFTGIASAAGVLDWHGEVIAEGAYTQTLQRKGSTFPLLMHHDITRPAGIVELSVDATSGDLIVTKGQPNLDTQDGREARALMKQGAIGAMSIGFNIPDGGAYWDKDRGVLVITEIDLWEVSLVVFPANPGAKITDVKHLHAALKQIELSQDEQVIKSAAEYLLGLLPADTQITPKARDEKDSNTVGHPPTAEELGNWKQLMQTIHNKEN